MIEVVYVSAEEAAAYHGVRPTAQKWLSMPYERQQAALTLACDYVDVMFGLPNELVRTMRSGGSVPPEVKKAVCELAVVDNLAAGGQPKQKSLSKGALSVTFEDTPDAKVLQYVRRLLAPLVKSGVSNIRVERG